MPHLPNSWILGAIFVGAFLFARYLLHTPRDYPLRGKLLGVTSIVIAALALVLIARGAKAGMALYANADQIRTRYLESRPADSLAQYIPMHPGVDSVRLVTLAADEHTGRRPSTQWTAMSNVPATDVVNYYRDPAHHAGWRVEFSAATMLMLVRDERALGQKGVERLRIQTRPAGAGAHAKTLIEYELTRRF
jgi:hypothetical protein